MRRWPEFRLPNSPPAMPVRKPTASWHESSLPVAPSPSTLNLPEVEGAAVGDGFQISLANFDGPFDLLLSLISKRQLDITEVSLGAVTDEFLTYVKHLEGIAGLDAASEFVVVAATLLDMKIVGLLPQGEFVDPEDVALLEARDLLFARLLQYRAFKDVSSWFAENFERESGRHPRAVRLEDKFLASAPELQWTLSLEDFHALAVFALAPREIPMVGLEHLHAPLVSIREQAGQLSLPDCGCAGTGRHCRQILSCARALSRGSHHLSTTRAFGGANSPMGRSRFHR